MSQFEEAAKPVLIAHFADPGAALNRSEQRVLAAWGWKTAAMLNRTATTRQRSVPAAHHHEVFRTRLPPKHDAVVFVGHYVGTAWRNVYRNWNGTLAKTSPDGNEPNAYCVRFNVGPIFFAVCGSASGIPLVVPETLATCSVAIWPRQAPEVSLADAAPVTDALFTEMSVINLPPAMIVRRERPPRRRR